jgi:D-alanine-D-alanine ligase
MVLTTNRPMILLLFGGASPEHAVSIASALNVYAAIDMTQHDVTLGYIDEQGAWWVVDSIAQRTNETRQKMTPNLGNKSFLIGEKTLSVDVIFPVLHGQNGEDGTVQGLAKLLNIPIVGCGIDGSVLCIDKTLTKQLLAGAGIPVVDYRIAYRDEMAPTYSELCIALGPNLFIKPAHLGSSVGVSKATDQSTFDTALELAYSFDKVVIIESAIVGRELEVAVLGATHQPHVSVVGEIVPDRDFYTYESKYDDASETKIVIPAAISAEVSAQIQTYAAQAFTLLRCGGLARIDFFVNTQGELYLNEVNTMPGFTNISMYPKLWEASGRSYSGLVDQLITLAV